MVIRKMLIDDYEGIYDLWLNTPGMGLNTTEDTKKGISAYLSRNPNTCFVCQKDDEIIGVILSGHDGRRGFIYHAAVKVSERRHGIGSKLLDCAMLALKEEGINKVALVVYSRNETGNAFWEKRGFKTRDDIIYRNKNINELTYIDI